MEKLQRNLLEKIFSKNIKGITSKIFLKTIKNSTKKVLKIIKNIMNGEKNHKCCAKFPAMMLLIAPLFLALINITYKN